MGARGRIVKPVYTPFRKPFLLTLRGYAPHRRASLLAWLR
jgi:hypothetical protein